MTKNNSDPRRGLPSASSMSRLDNCPGSLSLIEAVKKNGLYYDPDNADREAGLRIHAWLAAIVVERSQSWAELAARLGLDETELRTAIQILNLVDKLVEFWGGMPADLFVERRFWFPNRWAPIFSGQPDYVLIDEQRRRALLLDYKTGRKEAEPAADNLQLRTEAVLLKAAFPSLGEIEGSIVEPWVTWSPTRVKYAQKDLREARDHIVVIAEAAVWRASERRAGQWCHFCPARAACREAQEFVKAIHALGKAGLAQLPTGARGSKVIEDIKTVREILDSMEARYKVILTENPDALESHYLHEGKLSRSVSSIKLVRQRLGRLLQDDEIDECLNASVSRLEQAFAAKSGLKLGLMEKTAEKAFAELMGEVVESNRGAPYIARRSAKDRQRRALVNKT